MTISLLAVSLLLLRVLSSSIAFNPNGVAALPSPKILALMFIVMFLNAGLFLSSFGKSGRKSGEKIRAINRVNPLSSAIFIIPDQRHKIPDIVSIRSIEDVPLSSNAFDRLLVFPSIAEQIILIITSPLHM